MAPPPSQPSRRSSLSTNPLLVGDNFGRYRILKLLGRGNMGEVNLAHDTQLNRKVALKVPFFGKDDTDRIQRFYQEARVASTLHHPNLCPVFDVGEVDGRPFLTMAFIEGRPLGELLQEKKGLPLRAAAELVRKIALALAEAHRCGVIHRDLKPTNIMIDRRGEPIIMDFGLARRVEDDEVRLTQDGMVIGTPAYMAPEVANGLARDAGPAVDVYSLGVVLYELLTGQLPFRGTLQAVFAQVLTKPPPPPSTLRPDIDAELENICLTALAKNPDVRYPSMSAFAEALELYLAETAPADEGPRGSTSTRRSGPELSRVAPRPAPARRRVPRLPWLWLSLIGLIVAVGSCVLVLILAGGHAHSSGASRPHVHLSPGTSEIEEETRETVLETTSPGPSGSLSPVHAPARPPCDTISRPR